EESLAGISRPEAQVRPADERAQHATTAVDATPVEYKSQAAPHQRRALQAVITESMLRQGEAGGYLRVPAEIAEVLPRLDETYDRPERNIIAIDDDGRRWLWRFIRFKRASERDSVHGYRLMGLGAYLADHHAEPGDK